MQSFLPVILGGDIGAYALARELNDAYGVRSLLVTAYSPGATRDSAILDIHHFAQAGEAKPLIDELIRLARSLKAHTPDRALVLLANTEWRVQTIVEHAEQLRPYYLFSYPSLEALTHANDKEVFEQRAKALGIRVPTTHYEDFSGTGDPDWTSSVLPADLHFPVVAKPAASAGYEQLTFEGRKKVYRIDSESELLKLWQMLRTAGFRDRFMVQELIEGDDTSMYICVAYVDQKGSTQFVCSGHVLLGEHHPSLLGNPLAIIAEDIPEITEPIRRYLDSIDYRGFANFDIKRDARNGELYFLEHNPRMGRSNYYCLGAGINPMKVLIEDLLDGNVAEASRTNGDRALYTLVPLRLLLHYVRTPELRSQVRDLTRRKRILNPLANPKDSSFKRILWRQRGYAALVRDFVKYYPKPTRTGF